MSLGLSINHDIIIGLCSKLLIWLSYYSHPGYGKKLSLIGSNPSCPEREPSTLLLGQSANSVVVVAAAAAIFVAMVVVGVSVVNFVVNYVVVHYVVVYGVGWLMLMFFCSFDPF